MRGHGSLILRRARLEVMSNTNTGMTLVFGARREKRTESPSKRRLPAKDKGNKYPAALMPPSSCRGRWEA